VVIECCFVFLRQLLVGFKVDPSTPVAGDL